MMPVSLCFLSAENMRKGEPQIRSTQSDNPYVPTSEEVWIKPLLKAKTEPSRFHGKPVKIKLRIHSMTTHVAAKANQRDGLLSNKYAVRAGKAVKSQKNAPEARTVIG